jgi:hypothetical protein
VPEPNRSHSGRRSRRGARRSDVHYAVDDDAIDRLIGELDDMDDEEHADVSVEYESGWVVSAFQSGLVV